MSSPAQAEENDEVEEDVEFVSEGPLRPVSELINLLSDSEEEGCSSSANTFEDEISRRKRHVSSTLDRLAYQVAQEKQERADKCRAFQEKQISQKAHGRQELAFTSTNGINQEAKRCVDMWLKMPGLQPGVISAGSGRRRRPVSLPGSSLTKHTCPVINCGRVYDNASLLDGHLKRFDHSPCDPTISLKGIPSEIFACVACGQHFQTKDAWKKHLDSKVSSSDAEGHSATQTYQPIVCFACPACYLFFNLRDECLQHMSAKNHFAEALAMTEFRASARPVPVPRYAKNRIIALCKDTTFNVRCSLCGKVLRSHQAAQAHFNVSCRQGCAYAEADKTLVQVMKRLQVRGQCSLCRLIFLSQAEIERHKETTRHDVEVNHTMEKALLQYCKFSEIQHSQRAEAAQEASRPAGLHVPSENRNGRRSGSGGFPTKRRRLSPVPTSRKTSTLAWRCECGLQFSEEATAKKHLFAVNQIFHQCGVCGKHMGESSIARLHMSRFHGGAHLSNILYHCRKCKVEMPRQEDILSHVSDAHSGHTYFTEEEVPYESAAVGDVESSTSSKIPPQVCEAPDSKRQQTWMCRMCEDVFDSEAAAQRHCSDVASHSFQRFVCGHCPQRFFKESTVRRHCMSEHGGQIKSSYFCGLCDSMQFDSEDEFSEHYRSLHSKDYYCMDDAESGQPAVAESPSQFSCLCACMGSDMTKEKMKATYTHCMKTLASQGKCQYACAPCSVSASSYAEMKTHVHTKHAALNLEKMFEVECRACQESFTGIPSFHKHYHSRHCLLEPCLSSRSGKKDVKAESTAVRIVDAVEIRPDTDEIEDDTLLKFLNMENTKRWSDTRAESDDGLKQVPTMTTEEARESAELEEALKRSLLEY